MVKVKGIELETKRGKRVNLSIKEAIELYEELHVLFGAKDAKIKDLLAENKYLREEIQNLKIVYAVENETKS
jgi:hypothetical protein